MLKMIQQKYIKIIKQYFKDKTNILAIQKKNVNIFFKKYPQIKIICQQEFEQNPQWFSLTNLIKGIVFNIELARCVTCGKTLSWQKRKSLHCNIKCAYKNPEVLQHLKNGIQIGLQKKYGKGISNVFQLEEVKEKRKNTMQKKYGSSNVRLIPEIVAKYQKTCIQKYGNKNPLCNENIMQKAKNTMLQRHGVQCSFKSQKCREKIKNTMMQRYGVQNPGQSKELMKNAKSKQRQTNLKRYNVANVFLLPENKQKIIMKNKSRRYKSILSWNKYIIPLFTLEEYLKSDKDQQLLWKCQKCGLQFKQRIYHTTLFKQSSFIPRCLNCYPFVSGYSYKEKQLAQFCKKYFNNIKQNVRTFISPKEIDILIPDIKLAIEFNGLWHHSIQSGTALGYHLMKTEKCEEKGYRLIHIWQDDWQNNKEEIKQKLIDIFENKEVIDISKPLDRCWYSTLQFTNYTILPPEIVTKQIYSIENCGYIVLEKEY